MLLPLQKCTCIGTSASAIIRLQAHERCRRHLQVISVFSSTAFNFLHIYHFFLWIWYGTHIFNFVGFQEKFSSAIFGIEENGFLIMIPLRKIFGLVAFFLRLAPAKRSTSHSRLKRFFFLSFSFLSMVWCYVIMYYMGLNEDYIFVETEKELKWWCY